MQARREDIAAEELINDPAFLYRAGRKIRELRLVGENSNSLIIFLAALTTMLANSKRKTSVMVHGPSGSGKTTLIELPLKLFPPELIERRASISEKALAYGEGSLDGKILFVDEYRGGQQPHYLLRILQSEGEIAHEFATGGKTKITRRLGSPVVLTTNSGQEISNDDATRFLLINIDVTAEQNLAVLKAELGGEKEIDGAERDLKTWQDGIRLLKKRYSQLEIPQWMDYVAERVPTNDVRARRDWKRFLGLLEAIAICTPNPEREGKITFADYVVAYRLLDSAFAASACTHSVSELKLVTALQDLTGELQRPITMKEIREKLGWGESMTYKYVATAVGHGLIKHESATHEKNVKRILPVSEISTNFLPHPKQMLNKLKELGPVVKYIDPITGKRKVGKAHPLAA